VLNQKFNGDLRLITAAYYVGEKEISSRGLEYSSPMFRVCQTGRATVSRTTMLRHGVNWRGRGKVEVTDEKRLFFSWLSLAVLTATAGAQQTTIVPQVRTKPTADNKITAIELAAHFVTAIRVPSP